MCAMETYGLYSHIWGILPKHTKTGKLTNWHDWHEQHGYYNKVAHNCAFVDVRVLGETQLKPESGRSRKRSSSVCKGSMGSTSCATAVARLGTALSANVMAGGAAVADAARMPLHVAGAHAEHAEPRRRTHRACSPNTQSSLAKGAWTSWA